MRAWRKNNAKGVGSLMITYDDKQELFHLSTPDTSYVFGIVDHCYAGHIYYGKRLEDLNGLFPLLRTTEFPFTPAVCARDKVRFMETLPF